MREEDIIQPVIVPKRKREREREREKEVETIRPPAAEFEERKTHDAACNECIICCQELSDDLSKISKKK
jgi:hypothetical protein